MGREGREGREGGRREGREGGRERGRVGREEGREGEREGERGEGGRKGGREGGKNTVYGNTGIETEIVIGSFYTHKVASISEQCWTGSDAHTLTDISPSYVHVAVTG